MGSNKGFFLHDFFGRILPSDRNLFTPILEYLKWRRLTQNLGLLAWVALWLAACGFLSFSFVQNLGVLRGFTGDFTKPPELTENISDNLIIMDNFRNELLELQRANSHWWIPRLGLAESKQFEQRLQVQFLKLFKKGFLDPMDIMVAKELNNITPDTPERDVMIYAEHLVGRIKLLQADTRGTLSRQSKDLCQVLPDILLLLDGTLIPEIACKFEDLYLFYLQRGMDEQTARTKIKELQTALVELIFKKSKNFNWLVKWANDNVAIRDLTLETFWGPLESQKGDKKVYVDGAFTVNGYQRINEFMEYLEDALPGNINIASDKKKFYGWYQGEYFRTWKNFASSFSDGQFSLYGVDDWRGMASKMTTSHNPYFDLIKHMDNELKPFAGNKDAPAWVHQIKEVRSIIKDAATGRKVKREESILAKATHEGEKLVQKVSKERKILQDQDREERHIDAVDTFGEYLKNLEDLLPVSLAQSQAYKAASEFFPYSLKTSESKSPFFSAYGDIQKLKTYITTGKENPMPLKLLAGPLNFLVFYVSMETACSLQHDWEDLVLGGIQGVAPEKLPELLFSEKGVVWKFVQGPASPFLGRNQHGYFAKKARGAWIPFTEEFFSFITQGAEISTAIQPEYKVQITTLPMDVNDDAKKEPYEVSLELQCANGKIRLENYNYPASEIFAWSPDTCGNVTLVIRFEGLTLTKRYKGHDGFPLFLSDFKDGSKIFKVSDFPESKGILKEMNVSEIKISYEFVDNRPVMQLLQKVPRKTPMVIANCWSH